MNTFTTMQRKRVLGVSTVLVAVGILAGPSYAQNFLQNPGFENGTGIFETNFGNGVSTDSGTWGRWFAFPRYQSVLGNTAKVGANTTYACLEQGPYDPNLIAAFPDGWVGNNFAQMNPGFVQDSCDNTEKLIQGFAAPASGTQLTLRYKYIYTGSQVSGDAYVQVCGITDDRNVPLYFSGDYCGNSAAASTVFGSLLLPQAEWISQEHTFTVPDTYTALVVVFKMGGRPYLYPQGITAGVDEVFLGIPSQPPVCDRAYPSVASIWPPNHELIPVQVLGVTDPDGDDVTITIGSIFQDEPVNSLGDGNTAPDGTGVSTDTAAVRAERSGTANGRVYTIGYTADDGQGGTCAGQVLVSVPKSQGKNGAAVDDGAVYDSTIP